MKRFIALILALMLVCLPCALAEEAPTLTVTGTATVSLPADATLILLGVQETADDAQAAQSAVNTKIAAVRAAIVGMGIDNSDIVTESLYMYANYDYNSYGEERIQSYTASNTLMITVRDLPQTAGIIDAAFAAGANQLQDVSFYATDTAAAEDQAYVEALANAMHRANVVAQAAGMQCANIIDISVGETQDWADNAARLKAFGVSADAAAGIDIQQSNVTVTANVTITYSLSK